MKPMKPGIRWGRYPFFLFHEGAAQKSNPPILVFRVYFFCFVWSFGGTFCQYGELEEDPEAGNNMGSNQVSKGCLSPMYQFIGHSALA